MIELDRISLELTSRCGKACWFCYNASGPDMAARCDAREVLDFVTDCARNRIKAVSFGGGEPLEYPELFEVLAALRGLIFRSFTTNGLALDAMMETVVASAPDKVHVSIHFPGNEVEVARVIRQVRALDAAGVASGINLLVRASQLADATTCAAQIRAAGIGNDRIVYLPMRGTDTPTPDDLGRVAGSARFQSMSCLMACARSPSFVCSVFRPEPRCGRRTCGHSSPSSASARRAPRSKSPSACSMRRASAPKRARRVTSSSRSRAASSRSSRPT